MPRIMKPVVSPRGRVIVLTGGTLWLIAAMLLSATPEGASAAPRGTLEPSVAVRYFESVEGAPGMLAFPRMNTDANGRLYIVDRAGHRVIRLAADEIRADVVYGREGAGPGELMNPRSVAVDSNGNVFVTDIQLQRILKYRSDGTFLKSVTAPRVISVVVDSEDRVIARTARDSTLLQRYTNDLEEDLVLLARKESQHATSLGVLIAIDRDDRLFLLDQSDLTVRVFDSGMRLVDQWPVDPPQLRATVAMRLAAVTRDSKSGGSVSIDGVLSMALDPDGEHLVLTYFLIPEPDARVARIAWYAVDGTLELVEERDDEEHIFAHAVLPNGTVFEASAERVWIRARKPAINADVEGN